MASCISYGIHGGRSNLQYQNITKKNGGLKND